MDEAPAPTVRLEWPAAQHARIVIDRPRRHNALGIAELAALDTATAAIAASDARVVSIVAEGPSFGVGGDIAAFAQALDEGRMADWLREVGRHLNPAIARLRALDATVVVGAQGNVAGGSLGLLLAGDLVIAADDLRIDTAYARLGASPDAGASWFLPRLLGARRAFGLLALDTTLDAAHALALGLVNRVVGASGLRAEVDAVAAHLLQMSPVTLVNFKRLVGAAPDRPLEAQLDAEIDVFVSAAADPGFAERVRAFVGRGGAAPSPDSLPGA